MTKLSPAAAAVFYAYAYGWTADHFMDIKALAAALRAAADAIEPIDITPDHEWLLEQLLAIADELEAL